MAPSNDIGTLLAQSLLGGSSLSRVSDPYGLNTFQSDIAANDIYRTIGSQLLGSSSLFNNPVSVAPGINYGSGVLQPKVSYHPYESAAGSFLTSLLGGLAGDYGKQQEATQLSAVSKLLPQLLAHPDEVNAPEGVDADAFGKLKTSSILEKFLSDQKLAQEETLKDSDFERERELQKERYGLEDTVQTDLLNKRANAGINSLEPDAQTAIAKTLTGTALAPEDADALVKSPKALKLYNDLTRANAYNQSVNNQSRVSERSALDIAAPVSVGKDISQSLTELQSALGNDPTLLGKAFQQLPLGSDAYNAAAELHVNGARIAKALEGRVNDTTLKLYGDLLTSLDTEPLSAVIKRGNRFIQALNDDAQLKIGALGATGRDTSAINSLIGSAIAGSGSVPNGTSTAAIAELKKRGLL